MMKKLLVILVLLLFATPAMAQNWHFYGSLRTHVGYYDIDADYSGTSPVTQGALEAIEGPNMEGALGPDDSGHLLSLSGQSRFGARGQATENLFGLVEFGFTETNRAGKQQDPYLRLAYGTWNFGAGSLIVGKDYTPGTFLGYSGMIGDIGDQGDANMLVGGLPYIGRQPQLKLRMGDFDIALIERNTTLVGEDHTPRLEAAYVFRTPMVNVRGVAGFQTYDDTALDTTVTSYLLGLGATFNVGPAYVRTHVSYLQNAGQYGNGSRVAPLARNATADDDAETWQATLAASFKISPMLSTEVGGSYTMNEVGDQRQEGWLAYVNMPVQLDRGISVTPEFGYVSRGDWEDSPLGIDVEFGDMWYVTANFRVDF